MTYILNKQQKCLREKQTINEPFHGNYNSFTGYQEDMLHYHAHIRNLKSYPILPEQWEGYEDGAEVEEGEFELEVSIASIGSSDTPYAIPKQKQVSQTDSIKELFVDKLLAQLKEKDKRIKELEEALKVLIADHRKLYSFADMPWEDYAGRNALKKSKQALQNK